MAKVRLSGRTSTNQPLYSSAPAQIKEITLPHLFYPRDYQLNFMSAVPAYYSRGVYVWHRRAGKDKCAFNKMVMEAYRTKGIYYYFFPTYKQGRKVLWDAIDKKTGVKFLDHLPEELVASKNNTEMKLTLTNESIIQVIGTDDFDSIMGTNPAGCIFSEYSLQDPRAWDYIRPILRENKGWAIFIFTFRGQNHGYQLYLMAKKDPLWFAEILDVTETKREDGTPVITEYDIEQDRKEGMSDELIDQEYYCSPYGYVQGAYYAKQLKQARVDGRITAVPYKTGFEVYTFWDLGVDDSMTIWFMQVEGSSFRFIDYYENFGFGLEHYAKIMKEKGYVYGDHYFPHDITSREMTNSEVALSRKEVAENLGIKPILIVKRPRDTQAIITGIELGRNILSSCWFDERKCERGLLALEGYRSEYDEEKQKLGNRPVHDWCFASETYLLTKSGKCQIKDLPLTGEVLTLCGWKQYHSPRITRKNAQLVEVVFNDGSSVRCTPDHLFLTEKGWKSAEHLTPNTEIQSSLTQLRNILTVAYIEFGLQINIFQEAAKNFIGMLGLLPLEKFPKIVTYTTGMETHQIIDYRIWNASHLMSIYQKIGKKFTEIKSSISQMKQEKRLPNGTNQKKEDCGTEEMLKDQKAGQNGKENQKHVQSAIKSLWLLFAKVAIPKFIARRIANPLAVVSVKNLLNKDDVYCLTVPESEHFSLSNGAIVHNCSHGADSFRTFAVGYAPPSPRSRSVSEIMGQYTGSSVW